MGVLRRRTELNVSVASLTAISAGAAERASAGCAQVTSAWSFPGRSRAACSARACTLSPTNSTRRVSGAVIVKLRIRPSTFCRACLWPHTTVPVGRGADRRSQHHRRLAGENRPDHPGSRSPWGSPNATPPKPNAPRWPCATATVASTPAAPCPRTAASPTTSAPGPMVGRPTYPTSVTPNTSAWGDFHGHEPRLEALRG